MELRRRQVNEAILRQLAATLAAAIAKALTAKRSSEIGAVGEGLAHMAIRLAPVTTTIVMSVTLPMFRRRRRAASA
jgi:hypothetical protein